MAAYIFQTINFSVGGDNLPVGAAKINDNWNAIASAFSIDDTTFAMTLTVDLAVVNGGTGASTAGAARTNLGLAIGTDVQAFDATILNAADIGVSVQAFDATILNAADIGVSVQAFDAGLTSIAGLTTLADRMIYTTASDTYAVATLTAFGRSLIDDADAATARATLGLGSIATFAGDQDLQKSATPTFGETTINGDIVLDNGTTEANVSMTRDFDDAVFVGGIRWGRLIFRDNTATQVAAFEFTRTGTAAGNGAGVKFITGGSTLALEITSSQVAIFEGNILPRVDNSLTLGDASFRMSEIFAANGTINTSDEREKTRQTVTDPLAAKLATVAQAIKADIWCYKWNDAIAEKSDNARLHFGVGAQSIKEAFEAEGLDPHEYGLFCYDEFPEMVEEKYEVEVQQTEVKSVTKKIIKIVDGVPVVKLISKNEDVPLFNSVQKQDEQGNLLSTLTPAVMGKDEKGKPVELEPERIEPDMYPVPIMTTEIETREVESGVTLNRYGVRYNELWAFLTMYSA